MTNRIEALVKRDNSLCTYLVENIAEYAGDVAFEAIATKTTNDYALTVIAAAAAASDNTGYSFEKVIAKDIASNEASLMSASCQVKLDMIGNYVVSKSLNSSVSFYSSASDALSASRMQNIHDVIDKNLVIITPDYATAAQLTDLQTKINTFTGLSGSTTMVNATSPVKTKALKDAVKTGAVDVLNIKKLSKKYLTTNPTFYEGLEKACKIPPISVRHTPVVITITDSVTNVPLPNVSGTLSKTKELGLSNTDGIMNYTNVSAGAAIASYTRTGYITGVQNLKIKRGKTNTVAFALKQGIMTAEMVTAIDVRINAFIVAEEAKKAAKVAKAKVRREAKAAKDLVVSG